MNGELDKLRTKFSRFLVILLWLHLPVLLLTAYALDKPPYGAVIAGAVLAGVYHLSWLKNGIAESTRYISAVALMGEPVIFLYLLRGHDWQMDVHMYFFAMLALTIAWCDRRVIILAAITVVIHHLTLNFMLPYLVFPNGGNFNRVILHGVIVAFQSTVLIWFCNMLVDSFHRNEVMNNEIEAKNEALEERSKAAEAAYEAKGVFLANMSHEIRTPMNAILGFCHLIMRTDLTDKQRDYMSKISGAGSSLLRLINDILDFSKNEAGKLTLERRSFNIRNAVNNQIFLVTNEADAKNVRLKTLFAPDIPHRVIGDELRFNQVLMNIVSNAIKFSENGSVTVEVKLTQPATEKVNIAVSVTDTGIGLTQEQQKNLFNSFTQADSSTTRRFGGTGLGLIISKQIVEQMSGKIEVKSVANEGSTFTFNVVFDSAENDKRDVTYVPEHIQALRVLVADDNPASREILQSIFASWSMKIDLVASGEEVIGALVNHQNSNTPYDLLLLDWKMPGMDGLNTLKVMHADTQINQFPHVILISAYGREQFEQEAEKSGVTSFLTKPIEEAALLETIVNLFNEQKAPDKEKLPDTPTVSAHAQGKQVLLVEDNAINQEIAAELLMDAGLNVDTADNGLIAVEMVKANPDKYHAILMDVQMPVMDGIEATKTIRQTMSAEQLPIIALTAHAYEEERNKCFKAGMNDHVSKPIDPQVLVQTLDKWLHKDEPSIAQVPVKQTDVAKESENLPDNLPPFDIATALVRVNGKRKLLRKLIINFADSFEHVVKELKNKQLANDMEGARRQAHTLKGVAASLELAEVSRAAHQLELAYAAQDLSNNQSLLSNLEAIIKPALEAAQSLQPAQVKNTAVKSAGLDFDAVINDTALLRELLVKRSLRARSSFEELAGKLNTSSTEMPLLPVKQAIDKLDYEKALAALDQLLMSKADKSS
ncbi:signal transduction histidine kinase/DNA-binding response OmpR family regulator [Paenochrobactrum gallinarii]|uniref:histidine kinase n=1 Tax=Paenochrobactrum gallinarii TaxID=643673 RepID=A0A841LYI7_9HYPH|nr:hybrid sensor histidine kinase/response regulator [Paenochrobactrum gallinarii]MBB6262466.1 signal transduction histidine kinase/DNA-binding response OmpR family regulator [Paenochrobactrum gallinarii]